MVCSWDAEEFGLMGSKEWVEVVQGSSTFSSISFANYMALQQELMIL